jgi:hypothetical protein
MAVVVGGATFISSGIAALVRAREAATEAGVAFMVRNPSLALRRLVRLSAWTTCSGLIERRRSHSGQGPPRS